MFYKVVLNGNAQGQDIKNVLYYRSGLGVDVSGLTLAGSQALAGNVKQEIWPGLKSFIPNDYTLETIDVSPINDEFQLVYQMPYSEVVQEQGLGTGLTAGPAMCMNIKFNLEPTSILNGIKPPARGYIAIGPVSVGNVDETGFLHTAFMQAAGIQSFVNSLASNIEQVLPVPFVWFPIRLKQNRILGGLVHWEAYSDIKGAVLSRKVSFRRSRLPED
jgi:hypothetical protein